MPATVHQAPLPKFQFNQNGIPLSGGRVFTYVSGTTTKLTTYTDYTGTTPNENPIVLDANGQCDIWLIAGQVYTFVLAPPGTDDPPTDSYWTENGIAGINDASGSGNPSAGGSGIVLQTGDIKDFGADASNLAAGWLLCNGAPVSRTTYAVLFARVGTLWGAGDGSTTFNLPDYRGRVPAGADAMGGTPANRLTIFSAVLGAAGGDQNAQQDTITVSNPAHSHLIPNALANNSGSFGLTGSGTIGFATTSTAAATTAITATSGLTGTQQNIQPTVITTFAIWSGPDIAVVSQGTAPSGLPSATTSQLYGGSGAAGLADVITLSAGLAISGQTLDLSGIPAGTTSELLGASGTLGVSNAISLGSGLVLSSGTLAANYLHGASGSIGGGTLAAGAAATGTLALAGATTSMAVLVTPQTYPGDGAVWSGYVSSSGTVTIKVTAVVSMTPTASVYNVRAFS